MNWNQGYTSKGRLYRVNEDTWGDGEEITGLNSASVTRDAESTLIEDASINIDGSPVNGYVRLVLEAENNDGPARAVLGTFLVTSPKRSIKGRLSSVDLDCYSVLKPADDYILPIGWYFPKGGDPVAGAFELLADALQCPIEPVESDIRTDEIKIAENNESALSFAIYLLDDTGYDIMIDAHGRVTIGKKPEEVSAVFDTFDNDILMPEISDESDIFDIPNVLRVTDGSGEYLTIHDEDSEIGWEKWAAEQVSLKYGESLLSKGSERMEELTKTTRKISYTREFDPDVKLNDMALYLLPQQGIVGAFRIVSQSLTLKAGVMVSEIAEFETDNWRA